MGIPLLIATLEPYAVHKVLQGDIVIDGPALAYHILFICNREGIVQPSYQLLGRTAIAWLDAVTSRNATIQAIFFDGHLPIAKRPIRMQRTAKSLNQLKAFHSNYPKGSSCSYLSSTEVTVPKLFKCGTPAGKALLPPSFHVPAIIDALRSSSRYGPIVRLIPGEADAYCAQHLLQNGGTVITSDSDLLVHDLGGGRVVFFRDIYIDSDSNLTCAGYSPGEICTRLGLTSAADNRRLAYHRKCSPNSTLPRILRMCREPLVDKEGYDIFCQEYLHHEVSPLPIAERGSTLDIGGLDPRVSELVLQIGRPAEGDAYKIFLPILVEDTNRGSAWEQSKPIRQLAYTIAHWAIPGPSSSIQEYRRVNTVNQKGREVNMLNQEQSLSFINELIDLLKAVKRRIGGSSQEFWLTLSLALDIKQCQEMEKRSHALQILQESVKSPPNSVKASWEIIHLVAQFQASYYSMRVLTQMLSLENQDQSNDTLNELRKAIASFPGLVDFPDVQKVIQFMRETAALGTLKIIVDLLGLPETINQSQVAEKTKKAKKHKVTKDHTLGVQRVAPKNLFDLLVDQ